MRVAVIGHVEWATFARVPRVPQVGEIARASASWEQAAGGGATAALELARLVQRPDEALFFTAIGEGDAGRHAEAALRRSSLVLHVAKRAEPHPRVFTFIDDEGERTITVLAPPLGPHGDELPAMNDVDAVYFCKGDAGAVRRAREARVLVATARALPVLRESAVKVDVLVHSARDAGERYATGDLEIAPGVVVSTEGSAGGSYATASGQRGRWRASPPPELVVDSYGAGDCFAAALTFALGSGRSLEAALDFAAHRGVLALGRRGAGEPGPTPT